LELSKTTLNKIFGSNFQDLFLELEILCNVAKRPTNRISSIEDIKNSLYEHLALEYSELISSITIDNLPSIIILLYLNSLESLYFQPNNIGYYLLHAAIKLNSLKYPIKGNSCSKIILYHVGYLNKDNITEFIKSVAIKEYSESPIDPSYGPVFITVTTDYQLALKTFQETNGVNCIFEIHYFEDEDTFNNIFPVDEIYNKDIYFISTYEQFYLSKIIKLDNNKYKVIFHVNNDKVADLKTGYGLDIDDEEDCKDNLPIIKKNRKITSMHIWTKISSKSLNLIVESIVKKRIRPHIIKFRNYDFFADKNIEYITQLFYNNKDLRIIWGQQPLSDSLLTSFGTEKLYQALIFNKTLMILNLGNNNIGPKGSKFIASMIKDFKSLRNLMLGNNNIGNEGVKLIAEALKTDNIIESINLKMNDISDVGLAYICEAIRINDALMILTLDDNFITDEGLKFFANALAVNYSLVSVHFENNPVTRDGVNYLIDMLNPNMTGRYGGSRSINLRSENFQFDEMQKIKINNLTIIMY
jgi:hypothetical protein